MYEFLVESSGQVHMYCDNDLVAIWRDWDELLQAACSISLTQESLNLGTWHVRRRVR